MKEYAKALVAFLTSLGTWGATVFFDGKVEAPELFAFCGVIASAIAVYIVPNQSST